MARKESEKICMQCSKIIDTTSDKYVILATCNRLSMPDEYLYFHFSCWAEYFMKKVSDRAKIQVQGMQKMAVKFMDNPMIRSALAKMNGGEQVVHALTLDLDKTYDIKEKKENGKTKKRKK